MLLGKTIELEEAIPLCLKDSPLEGPVLQEKIKEKYQRRFSKETFYRCLRLLLREEVLVKQKGFYALNHHWIEKLEMFVAQDTAKLDTENILACEEGDKVSYTFKNADNMGIYWAHTYDLVFKQHDPRVPILIYHPHEWLILARPHAEEHFLKRFAKSKKTAYFAVAGSTALDGSFRKQWQNKYLIIGTNINLGLEETVYLNILGDCIFKVTVEKEFAQKIHSFFEKYEAVTETNRDELIKMIRHSGPVKFVFKKSKKEAAQWRGKFKKFF